MSREALVLLPGMMCDERLFGPQIAHFSRSFDVCVPTLAGAASIRGLAGKILVEVQAAHFNLAGLSMGGIVAIAMAAIAPDRVIRLALLDTNHRADPPERRTIRDRQIADVQRGRLREVIVDEMKPNYLSRENRNDQALLDLLIDMAMDCGDAAFVDQSIALRDRPDQTESLKHYRGPTLVLCGEEDQLCPPARHDEMNGLLENALRVNVPQAGHISTLENPVQVNAALQTWLGMPHRNEL